jgi:hypothetical protein
VIDVERPLMAQSGHSTKSRWSVSRRVSFARVLNLKVAPDYRSCKRVVTRRLRHSSYLFVLAVLASPFKSKSRLEAENAVFRLAAQGEGSSSA